MAATFNPDLNRALDLARQRLGDTDTNDALFPDETYMALLGDGAKVPARVAAILAADLAARFARKVTTDVDDQGKKWSDLQKHYSDLATRLSADALADERALALVDAGAAVADFGGGVMVGGTSAAEVIAARDDPDHPDNVPWNL